jgi:glycosyltransferase involved in cell wall biosynthesis
MGKNKYNTPLVSVVVSTKNEGRNIGRCLESVKKQTYRNIELIVVDNHSQDETVGISKRYTKKVYTKGPERSAQRNLGFTKSSGEFFCWFDADMEVGENVIKKCVEKVILGQVDALIIPERSRGVNFWGKCKELEKRCYLGDERMEAVRFVRASAFLKVGMLSENFISGEDWDITARLRRAKYKLGRVDAYIIHHEGNSGLWDDLKKKYYYATRGLPYIKGHVRGPVDVLMFVFRPAFIKNWRLMARDPLHAVGLVIMKGLEFGVGAFGILKAKYLYEKGRL